MGRLAAGILGLIVGFLIPGLPLGVAFAKSAVCPDAGWLGPFVGAPIGAVVARRLARPGPYIRFPTSERGQFGLSHLIGLVVVAAAIFGVMRGLGFWFAVFGFLCVASVWFGSRIGHGLTLGMAVATLSAFFVAAATPDHNNSPWTFWAVVAGCVIASLIEKLLAFLYQTSRLPS